MSYTLPDACVRALIAKAEELGTDCVTFGVMKPYDGIGLGLPEYYGVIREEIDVLRAALHKGERHEP